MNRWFPVLLALILVATTSSILAQAPPPKPKSKPAPEKGTDPHRPEPKAAATLLILADEDCELRVNGKVIGRVKAGSSKVAALNALGKHLVEAKASDGIGWSQIVDVSTAAQEIVRTELVQRRADAEKARRELAERAAQERAAMERAAQHHAELERRGVVVRGPLTWAPADNGTDVTWHEAKTYCEGLTLAGHDDWRLPAIEELEELFDPGSSAEYKVAPPIQLTTCCPWSSTASSSFSAWYFYFNQGKRGSDRLGISMLARALCVRRSGG